MVISVLAETFKNYEFLIYIKVKKTCSGYFDTKNKCEIAILLLLLRLVIGYDDSTSFFRSLSLTLSHSLSLSLSYRVPIYVPRPLVDSALNCALRKGIQEPPSASVCRLARGHVCVRCVWERRGFECDQSTTPSLPPPLSLS